MDLLSYLGYALALLVGISLGLVGSGGSILTVPILVYLMKIEPFLATAYSLFIVGSTAAVGSIKNIIDKTINYKIVLLFGIPSLLTVFATRAFLLPLIPNSFVIGDFTIPKSLALMILFSIVMLAASIKMIKPASADINTPKKLEIKTIPLLIQSILIGLVAGTVGAGGGFLIVPALVLGSKIPMKEAVATSLAIVTIQSLFGFLGDLSHQAVDWKLLLTFSMIAIIGIFIGIFLSKKIADTKLKTYFGWFVLTMACYIITVELLF